ncbi:serine/threonine-protein kinase [Algihabitans albus]|uniref:serine/threonine-protein kinase n=1 Tax=Algihabitans albus TaxID=2164067 RepID=UPI000E5C6267|nr:serine/threonine-protein kinase [Algihabitans albus]
MSSASPNGETIALNQSVDLLPGERLPEFDSPQAEAFGARERQNGNPLLVLVGRPDLAPRSNIMGKLVRQERLAMLSAVSWGVVDWPPAGGRRFVAVFQRPRGRRLQPEPNARFEPWREDEILRRLIEPLTPVLRDLEARSITHRAIRADNIFLEGSVDGTCLLGECVMAPPGIDQPAIYEPIEGMLALPGGRGRGYAADDLYALGVTIAVLLAGGNPVETMDEQARIQSKIHRGSYATLIGRTRLSLPMMEVLRGLLCDQRIERWTLQDLELWLGGRRLSPKQPSLPIRGQRAYAIEGTNYWSARAIAAALGMDWQAGVAALQRNDLSTWIRRALSDEELAERVVSAAGVGAGSSTGGGGLRDRLVSRILMTLDPSAPVRLRGFAADIDAVGQALSVHYGDPEQRQAFGELIQAKLPQAWLDSQLLSRSEHAMLRKSFDVMHHFMARNEAGYGIERCLYEYNEHLPCLSPILEGDYVSDSADLLPALERVAAADPSQVSPIDRHIAAFACARVKVIPDRVVRVMAHGDNEILRQLSTAYFLAEIQRATGQSGFPHLAAWIARLLTPVVEGFHNRDQRQAAAEGIAKAAASGDLIALARAGDDPDARTYDENGFAQARAEYAAMDREIADLEAGKLIDPNNVRLRSRQASSLIAGCVSSLGLLLLTVLYVT